MRCTPCAVLVLAVLCVPGFALPAFNHVVIAVEENHNYPSVIGNSSMPYLNSLAKKYGLATQYYANTHPSIGNYFMLATGQMIITNDSFRVTVTADHVVRHLLTAARRGNRTKRACLMPATSVPTRAARSGGTVRFPIFLT